MFRAAVGKFVMDVGTVDTLQQAWRRLPPTIQQRAMVIAQKQGIVEWFGGLVRQMPEAVSTSPLTGG